jgi:hypothetical protein
MVSYGRIRKEVVDAKKQHPHGMRQDQCSDCLPLKAPGDSGEKEHQGEKESVDYIVIALPIGCLTLLEGLFCLRIKLIGLFLQAKSVLWHQEWPWRRMRVIETIECQPGLEDQLELGPEALLVECSWLARVESRAETTRRAFA